MKAMRIIAAGAPLGCVLLLAHVATGAPGPRPAAPAATDETAAPEAPDAQDKTPHAHQVLRLSLAKCVRMAMGKNQENERAEARIEEAQAKANKLRGRFGPVVRAEANVMRWDQPTTFTFDLPPSLSAFVGALPPMTVQDVTTMQFTAVLAQPITSLWTVYEGYSALKLGEDVARYERDATAGTVADKVAESYFQALTIAELSGIAETAVSTIRAHVAQARALAGSEVIADHQVLEAEVRLAEAEAQLIQAREGVELARSNLAFQIGLSADDEVVPAAVSEKDLPQTEDDYDRATRAALGSRPEIAAARARAEQAEHGVRAAWSQMLPEIDALAGAQYMKGSQFQRESQYFVGAKASWNVWEWGATYYGIDEAKALARQASSGRDQLEEGIRLEVRKAQTDLRTARRQLEVSRRAVGQAEENLRIVQSRYAQNAASSTDVLDAVALLERARVNQATALHSAFRAAYALRRAEGQPALDVHDRQESEP